MKKLILLITLMISIIVVSNAQKSTHRFYPVKSAQMVKTVSDDSLKTKSDSVSISDALSDLLDEAYYINTNLYFAPVANISVLKINSEGADFAALPGIGYGLNWKPKGSSLKCESLFGLNTFLNLGATITSDIKFTGAVSEMLSIYDNILSVGGMYDIGQEGWYLIIGTTIELKW